MVHSEEPVQAFSGEWFAWALGQRLREVTYPGDRVVWKRHIPATVKLFDDERVLIRHWDKHGSCNQWCDLVDLTVDLDWMELLHRLETFGTWLYGTPFESQATEDDFARFQARRTRHYHNGSLVEIELWFRREEMKSAWMLVVTASDGTRVSIVSGSLARMYREAS